MRICQNLREERYYDINCTKYFFDYLNKVSLNFRVSLKSAEIFTYLNKLSLNFGASLKSADFLHFSSLLVRVPVV